MQPVTVGGISLVFVAQYIIYEMTGFSHLHSILAALPLCPIIEKSHDADTALDEWTRMVNGTIDFCVPRVGIQNSTAPPWIDGNEEAGSQIAWFSTQRQTDR